MILVATQNKTDFIRTMNENPSTFFIYYGHGSMPEVSRNQSDQIGKLHIGDDEIDMIELENNIKVVPNYLDEKLWWVSTKRSDAPDSFKKVNDGIIRIGYIGTPTHNADLKIVVDAIKKIEKI